MKLTGVYGIIGLVFLADVAHGVNFPFESIQLGARDITDFPAIDYGDTSIVKRWAYGNAPECRAFPGDASWPLDSEWTSLNQSLNGVLIKPAPAGSVCYPGPSYDAAQCSFLVQNASQTRFWLDDPLTVLTQWPLGSPCEATLTPQGSCTQGGYPVYVVNVTTVKHVQAAVNFARNKNLRLVVK
jgi:hypothetical protein